jgi:hypothetical protein
LDVWDITYAADAPRISCNLARVKKNKRALKNNVKIRSKPTERLIVSLEIPPLDEPPVVIRASMYTGAISSRRMKALMMLRMTRSMRSLL